MRRSEVSESCGRRFKVLASEKAMDRGADRGFSLIELLIVAGIFVVAVGLVVPAFNSIADSSAISTGAMQIQDELLLARGLAVANSRNAEVRFYQPTNGFQALRVFIERPDGTFEPARRIVRLPEEIVMDGSTSLSPLLNSANLTAGSETNIPGFPASTPYRALRFRPSGAAQIAENPSESFLTIRQARGPTNNFASVQILPDSGRTIVYRP